MAKCVHHPGREGILTINRQNYCVNCQNGIIAARNRVDRHVMPKNCFIWYTGGNNWQPIAGTGCAHWVAHQLGIRKGSRGDQCLEGYTFRVSTLIQGLTVVALSSVRVNDIYVTPNKDHIGLVSKIVQNPGVPGVRQITIRHDSSRQGRVADNDFASYFHGVGKFYR